MCAQVNNGLECRWRNAASFAGKRGAIFFVALTGVQRRCSVEDAYSESMQYGFAKIASSTRKLFASSSIDPLLVSLLARQPNRSSEIEKGDYHRARSARWIIVANKGRSVSFFANRDALLDVWNSFEELLIPSVLPFELRDFKRTAVPADLAAT